MCLSHCVFLAMGLDCYVGVTFDGDDEPEDDWDDDCDGTMQDDLDACVTSCDSDGACFKIRMGEFVVQP